MPKNVPLNNAPNEIDELAKYEQDLSALADEIDAIQDGVADEYIEVFCKEIDADESKKQTMLENPREFLKAFVTGMQGYLEQKLAPKLQGKADLEQKLKDGKQDKEEKEAMSKLREIYKDADFEDLVEYFENELTKKQQAEFSNLTLLDGLKKLYEMKYADKLKEEKLPEEYEGVNPDDEDFNNGGYTSPLART